VAGQLQGGSGLSESPPCPVPARKMARGGAGGRARLRRPSGSNGDGDVQALLDKERNVRLAPGLAEERDKAEEGQGEVADVDPRLRRLPLLRRGSSGSAVRGKRRLRRLSS
jgi:hypothetical protein